MKKFILLLFIGVAIVQGVIAQSDSWSIKLNKKVLLQTPVETSDPIIYLGKSAVQAKNILTIQYTTADPQPKWNRLFYFNDESEKNYKQVEMKRQSGSISIPLKDLKQAAAANKTVFVYTTSLPTDPAQAALVRVRRILLCKIQWKK